jgi:ribosome-associated translation inhibitor RaiA
MPQLRGNEPILELNKRGANQFGKGPFRKSTWNTRTKPYAKPPLALDPIQVSSNLESPHKKPREVSADGLEPLRKTKSEPTSPYRSQITPTSPTSLKGSKPSSEIIDSVPTIEQLQKENHQLLQQLEERNTVDVHLHHDNVVLQGKVNSLQWLVDEMTKSNHSLKEQLKKHKRHKAKSTQQEGEASKADPPQQA